MTEREKRVQWFQNARFGMFLHWGLYAIPGRGEWYMSEAKIPAEQYEQYMQEFTAKAYDPRDWARRAKRAGMQYVVLTAKHHDGFCLFDSKLTDYKSTNAPCGRDLVREFVDAVRAEGLRVGLYYSLIDWHHPEFPIDPLHPRRDDPDAYEQSKGRDIKKYAQYMRDQVTELLTNYGKIDILWFDFSYSQNNGTGDKAWQKGKGKDDWEAEKLIATARALQPHIIIDNRTEIDQDLWTPEQYEPDQWVRDKKTGELVTWEACHTFSGSWGYFRDEQTWKSPEMLIRLLVNTVSRGGNLLMNVGPTSRGYLDYRAEEALKVFADWMKYNSRSIYGCTMAEPEFKEPRDCRLTQSEDGKRLYLHLFAYPFGYLRVPGLGGKVEYAQFLHDGSEVRFTDGTDCFFLTDDPEAAKDLVFYVPNVKPHTLVPVIEIFLKD